MELELWDGVCAVGGEELELWAGLSVVDGKKHEELEVWTGLPLAGGEVEVWAVLSLKKPWAGPPRVGGEELEVEACLLAVVGKDPCV